MARISFEEFSIGQPVKSTMPSVQTPQQAGVSSRVLRDIPSDFMEMGRGIRESVTSSGNRLGDVWRSDDASFMQKVAATGPQLGKGVLDVAGEAAVGYGKLLTTDEFEKAVTNKLSQAGQAVAEDERVKKIVAKYNSFDNDTKFILSQIAAPFAEVALEVGTLGGGGAVTQGFKQGLKGAVEGAGETLGQGVKKLNEVTPSIPGVRTKPKTVVEGPVPTEVKSQVVKEFDTAIKPNLISKQTPGQRVKYETQVNDALETIANNAENIRLVDQATGDIVSGKLPENLKDLVDALEQTKQSIFKQYDELAVRAGEIDTKVDVLRAANELDSVIKSNSLKLSNPDAVEYAKSVKARLMATKNLSPVDIQEVIKNYNASLDAFYRNPTPEGLTRSAVDALVANQLRKILDDQIGSLTGANYQVLKNKYASLSAVERDILRAYNRDARKNTKGLIDFTDVLTGGQVVSGILSFNPAMIAQGLAGKAISGAIKMVNDPNRKVKQIFEQLSGYKQPSPGFMPPTQKRLPAGDASIRSQVSSGQPISTGGQTAAGKVEPGLTERTREGAVRRSDSEGNQPLVKDIQDLEVETVEEIKAQMLELSEAGLKKTEDGYIRYSTFPKFVPSELRDSNLFGRVWDHIGNNTFPRENAVREIELYEIVKSEINRRVFDKQMSKNKTGVSSADIPFALILTTGAGVAAYYTMGEDGGLMALPVVGYMAANPATRKMMIKELERSIGQMEKTARELDLKNGVSKDKPTLDRLAKGIQSAKEEIKKLESYK